MTVNDRKAARCLKSQHIQHSTIVYTFNLPLQMLQIQKCIHGWWAKFFCVAAIFMVIYLWATVFKTQNSIELENMITCAEVEGIFLDSCDIPISRDDFLARRKPDRKLGFPDGSVCQRTTDGVYVKCLHGEWIDFGVRASPLNRSNREM